jgi:hypothetical protein
VSRMYTNLFCKGNHKDKVIEAKCGRPYL